MRNEGIVDYLALSDEERKEFTSARGGEAPSRTEVMMMGAAIIDAVTDLTTAVSTLPGHTLESAQMLQEVIQGLKDSVQTMLIVSGEDNATRMARATASDHAAAKTVE